MKRKQIDREIQQTEQITRGLPKRRGTPSAQATTIGEILSARSYKRRPLPRTRIKPGVLSPGMGAILAEHRRRHRAGENPVVIYWRQKSVSPRRTEPSEK